MSRDAPSLEPKNAVDLILSPGIIRRTFILDISGSRIVLANPRPPLDAQDLMHPAILTYLPAGRPDARFGFDVLVLAIPDDYVAEGTRVPAAVVVKTSPVREMDLRAFPRIKIDGLRMFLDDEELDIMNVSAGGAHLLQKRELGPSVTAGSTVVLSLIRGGDRLEREAKVLRLWRVGGSGGFNHLAVKFFQPVDF